MCTTIITQQTVQQQTLKFEEQPQDLHNGLMVPRLTVSIYRLISTEAKCGPFVRIGLCNA